MCVCPGGGGVPPPAGSQQGPLAYELTTGVSAMCTRDCLRCSWCLKEKQETPHWKLLRILCAALRYRVHSENTTGHSLASLLALLQEEKDWTPWGKMQCHVYDTGQRTQDLRLTWGLPAEDMWKSNLSWRRNHDTPAGQPSFMRC
jgi:hypothetical protein